MPKLKYIGESKNQRYGDRLLATGDQIDVGSESEAKALVATGNFSGGAKAAPKKTEKAEKKSTPKKGKE